MASIVVVRCEHCRRANEWRTPMVSVERVNAERERLTGRSAGSPL